MTIPNESPGLVSSGEIDPFLRPPEVRGVVGHKRPVSPMTLWRWRKSGIFPPPVVINGRNFWRRSAVVAWLDERQAGGPKAA